jgi:ethanolamine-phosphate cytidylyltransferase
MTERKPIRVWADGCFDMMHFGHANALRQAKELGDILVVGVHSDAAIRENKGPPVMKEQERYEAVRSCKWVDEVVEDAPYMTELAVLERHNIDFCIHGEVRLLVAVLARYPALDIFEYLLIIPLPLCLFTGHRALH